MRIVLLGSGNVATHLSLALQQAGNKIVQVWSREIKNAETLADRLQSEPITQFEDVCPDADLYLVSVVDDAIIEVSRQLNLKEQLIVHTSGTTGMEALEGASVNIGVMYPIQTFSKLKPVDFTSIPLAIEGNSENNVRILSLLSAQITSHVLELSSERRRSLHVAAVFACNFSNHLYTLAKEILIQHQLDFNLIRPLIAETAAKVQEFEPDKVQTGPAVRNDKGTLDKQLDFLKNSSPQLVELYDKLSKSIIDHYKAL
jgi:predicted short-subunit dehydrogenase-like oxidoreductase (DUF2520 family)